MSKTTAPLLSFGASGALAKTQVYATWRGISYVRRYVVPANPNTTGQQETRGAFSWLNDMWRAMPSLVTAAWTLSAKGQPLTDRNLWIKKNLPTLRAGTDLTGILGSPGNGGGPQASAVTASAASGVVTVDVTSPTAPVGWTITSVIAILFPQQAVGTGTKFSPLAGEDAATHDAVVINAVPTGTYVVSAFPKWAKPDGSIAYGQSINTTVTVS